MTISVSQIYIEVGVKYDFSHHFQRFIGEELTKRVVPSGEFIEKYGDDFNLIFRMSAKAKIAEPEVRGPTVFRKAKDVEYTIFLTFDMDEPHTRNVYRRVLSQLLDEIARVLQGLKIDTSSISRDASGLIDAVLADPKMIRAA